jgi:hypothetical protein
VDVLVSPTTDAEKLRVFLAETFPYADEPSVATPLLVGQCSQQMAHQLKAAAAPQGVYLEIRPSSYLSRRYELASALGYLASLGFAFSGGVLLMPFTVWAYRRTHRRPFLVQSHTEEWLSMEPALNRFLPALQAPKSPAMENFLLKMTEKYYLMQPVLRKVPAQDREQLDQVLDLSARVAVALTEVDQFLANPEFHLWGQRLQALEKQLEDLGDPEARQRVLTQTGELKQKLAEYFTLEENFGGAMQNLSRLQFLFSQLVGKLLVYQTAWDERDREELRESTRQLSLILEASRELEGPARKAA